VLHTEGCYNNYQHRTTTLTQGLKMVKQTKKKSNNLKELLRELNDTQEVAVAKIEDTLTPQQKTRLKPLAWLIAREKYTVDEVIRCMLAYEESPAKRADDIITLIRSRQKDKSGGQTAI